MGALRWRVACAAGSGTVTAVVRRTGLTTNENAYRQGVTVEARAPQAPARPRAPNPQAREFTAQWQAPGDTGGTALTGYHVIMRPNGAAWPPDSQAKKVGASTRSQRFSGLTPNRIYWFKVKACNGATQTRCSGWSPQASVTLPIGMPGTPRWGSFTADTTQIRVTWSAPGDTGGVGLTGYGLRHWQKGGTEPSSAQVVVNAQTSARTFGGLTPNTTFRFSIQACNGTNRCSGWTNKDGRTKPTPTPTPEPPPPAQAPDRVEQPTFSEIRSTAFTVTWSPPRDNGTAIRGYGLRWRVSGTGAWTTSWKGKDTKSHTVDEDLSAGTTYVVQVKACNGDGANGRHRCGAWSRDGRVTTLAETPPDSTVPANLDVAPLPVSDSRRARVTWSPATGATGYVVQVRPVGSTAEKDWQASTGTHFHIGAGDSRRHGLDFELESFVPGGLRAQPGYQLQVRAITGRDSGGNDVLSEPSETIVIMDTAIRTVNGGVRAGEADVNWRAVDTILGDTYAGGTYRLRYRRVGGDHTSPSWEPATAGFGTSRDTPEILAGSTSHPIDQLLPEQIYAIQLRYETPSDPVVPFSRTKVFAVRDAYVWASTAAPDAGARVASFPLNNPLTNSRFLPDRPLSTYEYRICTDTFPYDTSDDEPGWHAFVDHAFQQWSTGTGGLVQFVRETNPCANYVPVAQALMPAVKRALGPSNQLSDATLRSYLEGFIQRARYSHVLRDAVTRQVLQTNADQVVSEVFVFENNAQPEIFDMSRDVALTSLCGEPGDHRQGCAVLRSEIPHPTRGLIVDIAIRKRGFFETLVQEGPPSDRGRTIWSPELPSISLSRCVSGQGNKLAVRYQILVHEAGHAVGISSGSSGRDRHHPSEALRQGSVMVGRELICAPTPWDAMAVYALYQSR